MRNLWPLALIVLVIDGVKARTTQQPTRALRENTELMSGLCGKAQPTLLKPVERVICGKRRSAPRHPLPHRIHRLTRGQRELVRIVVVERAEDEVLEVQWLDFSHWLILE